MPEIGSTESSFEEILANLLRSDRLASIQIPDMPLKDKALLWWFLIGRVELARGTPPTVSELGLCFEPLSGWPTIDGVTMTRAMLFLWHARPELQERFSLDDPVGFWDFVSWFYTDGVREHLLADHVPPKIKFVLNQRATTDFWVHASSEEERPPVLLALVYRARPELAGSFNVKEPAGRLGLLAWFFSVGARRLGIYPLISDQWRMWCFQTILTGPCNFECPRIAHLNWKLNSNWQSQFSLQDQTSHQAFLVWFEEKLKSDDEWKWLRVPVREKRLETLFSTQTRFRPPSKEFGVNLIGFAYGELGIGEDIRMAAAVCDHHGIPYNIININPGGVVRQGDQILDGKIKAQGNIEDSAPYPVNIFCLTGFDTSRVYLQLGPTLFSHRYNVGWWPWELPVWPKRWAPAFDLVDEIWAATQYNVEAYRQATSKPVKLVPLTVQVDRVKNRSRQDLKLPEIGFLFLYIFDFNSYLARKNPGAALDSFSKAFNPNDDSVRLVLKTMHARDKDSAWLEFKKKVDSDPRIILINQTMDREDVLALVKSCDAYLSLHRAEGFGRTLAEAMLFGKPVIGSDFSGNKDFMFKDVTFPVKGKTVPVRPREYPFVAQDDDAFWFDADTTHAAERMRQVRKTALTNEFKTKLIETARNQFAVENSRLPAALRSIFMRMS